MRALLLHLTGPLRGLTLAYAGPRISVGSAAESAVRLEGAAAVRPRHAEIEFVEEGCSFYLRALDGQVFVNRQEVEEIVLADGDLVEFGVDGPRARFRIQVEPGRVCKPVRAMLRDASDVAQASGLGGFTRSLVRDLLRHATWQLKVGVPAIVLAVFAVAFWFGWLGGGRAVGRYADEVAALRRQVDTLRELSVREVEALRADLATRSAQLDELVAANAAFADVHDRLALGVCLLHGRYGFELPGAAGDLLRDPTGEVVVVEYTGTGFLVREDGVILTNRHIVRPWEYDASVERLVDAGLEPRLLTLTATFPGRSPIAVDQDTVRVRGDKIDVAGARVAVVDAPVIGLSELDPVELRGARVLVVGYPTGVRALLAKATDAVVEEALDGDPELGEIIARLAKRGAVSPTITAGRLGDVREDKLVYDAETTSGGSGGPVFARDGRAIGVNFAILREFGGSNFGVPIRFAADVMPD